MAMGAVPRPVL